MDFLIFQLKKKSSYIAGASFFEMEDSLRYKKVKVGNDQEMAQSERNSHTTNQGVGKN